VPNQTRHVYEEDGESSKKNMLDKYMLFMYLKTINNMCTNFKNYLKILWWCNKIQMMQQK
jgi:hypothetical protein